MQLPKVTLVSPNGDDVLIFFSDDRHLKLVPHIVEHSVPRQWNHPFKRSPSKEVKGLESVTLYADNKLKIELDCPRQLIVKLDHGYRQRHLALYWGIVVQHFYDTPNFLSPHVCDTVGASQDLIPLLNRGSLRVASGARPPSQVQRLVHVFHGGIGGL